jgi:prepilin-type processing-associated H-X9-DG protein
VDDIANANGDCDGKATGAAGGEVWAGCGMLPRYRYTRTCPVAFVDGHAKAMSKGSITFGKNIWVGGALGQLGLW